MQSKKELRDIMLKERKMLSEEYRLAKSAAICNSIWQLIKENNVKVIHTYLPIRNEVDVFPVLDKAMAKNKTIIAPKTLENRKLKHLIYKGKDQLKKGIFKTWYPSNSEVYEGKLDMILVPGLAFSKEGKRLGYGAGYYDSFLAKHPNALKVGVGYPNQIINEVPLEKHDVYLDTVIYH